MSFPLVPPTPSAPPPVAAPYSPEIEAAIAAGMDRDRLKILEIVYYVAGGVTAVGISFLLIHFSLFLYLGLHPHAFDHPNGMNGAQRTPPPPGLMLGLAAGIGVIIMLGWIFGALQVYAGYCLRQRQHRLFILIVAGLECIFIPWGTVLGVFTFIVFDRSSIKRLFGAA